MSHRSRKGRGDCLNQKGIVIVNEKVRIDPHSPHLAGLDKQIQKTLPILIVKKDLLSGGAPIHDMVVGTRVLNPQGTGHAGDNTLPNPQRSTADLTPSSFVRPSLTPSSFVDPFVQQT